MALVRKLTASSSSAAHDGINPGKIKVQMIRVWKGDKNESGNSVDMVLLDSSGTNIHATIGEAYSKWIQDIGGATINESNRENIEIDVLEDLMIADCKDPIKTLVKKIYGESFPGSYNPGFFQGKAILCSTNEDVNQINDYMLSQISGEETVCLSADSISPLNSHPSDYMRYPPELLNSIKAPGLPNHCLRLKVGVPVILLQDIMPNHGLCNGTRLQITRLGGFALGARILTGARIGEEVIIPRIPSHPTDENFPIKMQRKQFPLAVSFAMTINKNEGQPLSKIGIYQPRRVLPHGPMYVAVSKGKTRDGLKVLITNKDGKPNEETSDVVFKEVGVSED
ncbi:unnamed protein product [Brassica oleracea var. botrytis]